jgi:hypothetical protein
MADTMLTVDMVSVGLLLSDGDIDISLEVLFKKVEDYLVMHEKYYGTSVEDYRSSIIFLCYFEFSLVEDFELLYELRFRQIILEMLHFINVYFNDEGESWHSEEDYDESAIRSCFKMDVEKYSSKMKLREAMIDFFRNCKHESIPVDQVKCFMMNHSITEQILLECPYRIYY